MKKEETVNVTVALERDIVEWLDEKAFREDGSRSREVRKILREAKAAEVTAK